MTRRLCLPAVMMTAGLILTGCGGSDASGFSSSARPELKVTGAYMPQPVTGDMAAGYFTVTNSGGADTLTSVTSDLTDDITLHSSEGGTMREEKSFAVPADGSLVLDSGGNHLMFANLGHRPRQGEKVSVQLHFAESGTVTVDMPVKPATYHPMTGH
ncbi:copper chaperone PCu(A)C [Streptomyces sp. NPDC007264]|uniref:copper chaperone PCu(A)C n=1 Tax=Streptomyces sp. NPDC007264 TaxID=3364777 RepID=UPI0036D815DA